MQVFLTPLYKKNKKENNNLWPSEPLRDSAAEHVWPTSFKMVPEHLET